MRDAFGGTFLIEILMVFVVLFVSFTAVIVNVAKTFRIKNEIINIVEQTQYYPGNSKSIAKIDDYINNAGYQTVAEKDCNGYWGTKGYCIEPQGSESNGSYDYYKVTVYVSISLPFFGIDMTLPVSGESKSYPDLT